ncbi:endonuclease domain-containing protein [Cypionkella sp. TWP1-2-1b2]|uniref:endonuclease domain-containing protein n=1 Tax=Cypionkella sp. TWP1-2-1b2 TaxID=2804675 RepID=UPI003CE79166
MRQNQIQTAEARVLRQNLSPAEHALWSALRDRRFMGLKFRRLAPLGPYIVDFYCAERSVVLEVFGDPNPDRAAWLTRFGCRVLRLDPHDILTNLPGCLQHLAEELAR